MTPADHGVIMSLAEVPGNGAKGSLEDVLRHFGATNGAALGLFLLDKAVEQQDSLDVEMALIVRYVFGFTPNHLDPLLRLCNAGWHISHEDVVTALGKLRAPQAVEALYQATQRVPKYLDFDDSRALAVKAIWALVAPLDLRPSKR